LETLLAIWASIRAFWAWVDAAQMWVAERWAEYAPAVADFLAPAVAQWDWAVLQVRGEAFALWAEVAGGAPMADPWTPWLIWGLFEITTADFGYAGLLIFAAGMMRGFAGFGAGMTMSPALALIWGPVQGVAIGTFLNTVATIQLLPNALKHAQWREILPICGAAMLVAPLGVYVLLLVDADIMRRAIAIVVLIGAVLLLFGVRYRGQGSLAARFGVGATSGLLSGSVGAGGPPVVIYLMGGAATAQQVRANMILIPNFIRLSVLAAFVYTGVLLDEPLWRGILMFLPFAIGTLVGAAMFSRSHERLYRIVAIGFLFTVSLTALLA
jgi:uncharacterized membrane protein YfcA